ncbi:hypothetical protein [Gordonia neofelifaecis]|uniref:Copper(I)-binding protein n=1 Tax=Gordonia neofelifaecis NRRL B-59395 TaxID=644548 RepID=F1YIV4_9ACTN|nr:hypothetical protein [Gordonia neofelifaecis]EGD55401.1 copper(I)-binding protein [Gordonia neofelifaecis NRRL B-59395]
MVSVLNRSTRRLASAAAVGALGIAIALGTTACGAGKISQTANQEPAVNGAGGTITLTPSDYNGQEMSNGSIAIRNARVVYPVAKADQVFGDGGPFVIAFSVANDSATRVIKLESVSAKTGNVKMTPPTATDGQDPATIRPTQGLIAGPTVEGEDSSHRFAVELTNAGDTVAPGLTVPLTFNFSVYDLSGKQIETVSTTIETPVDAGNLDVRSNVGDQAQSEASN